MVNIREESTLNTKENDVSIAKADSYLNNPLIHEDRRLSMASSAWVRSFSCETVKPLIICRGPIRKETMDVFTEMGITEFGILLSEKDSIVYRNAQAPELRVMKNPAHVHRVPDYTGASREERLQRIEQIIAIARANDYDSIFAGYGFMAEDEEMVASMERAGLRFIGPCSKTVHDAGLKDEAKRTALNVGVSVTPGVDNATTLTLLGKCKNLAGLKAIVQKHKLKVAKKLLDDAELSLEDKADAVLAASYAKGIDLCSINEISAQVRLCVEDMYAKYPQNRIRLKAISGGGGKGQRILAAPGSYKAKTEKEKVKLASEKVPGLVLEILNEVKTTGVGDNKNVLIELNIETTRHQEIQVIGNGKWSLSLGARDCSLQMHEQKLLEVSVTKETLQESLTEAERNKAPAAELKTLRQDVLTLAAMEEEAERFGEAVGLDSVSTFECIVDRDKHFFMEMNTRIQVEHRVTELCYALEFVNPDNNKERFRVNSLVEAMVLLAFHKERLPKPQRVRRLAASVEARLNATNAALVPHAGGVVHYWTDPQQDEIRDDQGICLHNPDTNVFMKYTLAGAYDSNIALLLTHGEDRLASYQKLSDILCRTKIRGKDLATNLEFHYGLVNWFIGNNINARPTTQFILPYLTSVGLLKERAGQIDLNICYREICDTAMKAAESADQKSGLSAALQSKQTMLIRPLSLLLNEPHILAGWISANKHRFAANGKKGKISWLDNPLVVVNDMYRFLNMSYSNSRAPANMIWDHDLEVLHAGLAFYAELQAKTGIESFTELSTVLSASKPCKGIRQGQWKAVQSAHAGFQAGLELLSLLPYLAFQTGFFDLKVNADLSITIPERLQDPELQAEMSNVLVPPPVASSDEILAVSGGMLYPREAPGLPEFVNVGDHFDEGDPIYIVEVMKMFNKVYAPYAGTIEKILVEGDGVIISKGQPLFKIKPDVQIEQESPEVVQARAKKAVSAFLSVL
ncbi:MAG: biotin/lipoyl-containing protein [Pseudomonadales bacterium]